MANLFQSAALQALYDGTAANAAATTAQLNAFRAAAEGWGGINSDPALKSDIESLDRRIATFEQALIGSIAATGKSTSEYPYDRIGLRREFLDEVTMCLLRQTDINFTPYADGTVITTSAPAKLPFPDPNNLGSFIYKYPDVYKGSDTFVVQKSATTGSGIFDGLNTNVPTASDPRLAMLTAEGDAIFTAYANLIDAVFAAGDARANNPARTVEVAAAIQPLTVDGATYDRVGQTTQLDPVTNLAVFTNYLVESTTPDSRVIKDAGGDAALSGPVTTTARRILLSPTQAAATANAGEYTVTLDGNTLVLQVGAAGLTVSRTLLGVPMPATVTATPPLLLNVPGKDTEFPDVRIVSNQRFVVNGTTYLAGISTENKLYVTSLATTNRTVIGATANLSGMEYLLFYNEARIRILRAQLAYKEAVVREIQDDLKKANDAMSDLEAQSGLLTATDSDGAKTGQYSSLTFRQSQFQATNAQSGSLFFSSSDPLVDSTEWATSRANLKNYIDRRSSEAQDASLDYQNVLNRFNNALEVMAKLQEKLDTLLKGSLRNIG